MIRYWGCCWIRCRTNASLKSELRPNNLQCKYIRQKFWGRGKSPSKIQMTTQNITDRDWIINQASADLSAMELLNCSASCYLEGESGFDREKRSPTDANPYWAEHMLGIIKHEFFLGSRWSTFSLQAMPIQTLCFLMVLPATSVNLKTLLVACFIFIQCLPGDFAFFPSPQICMWAVCPVYAYSPLGIQCPGLMDWLLAWFMAIELNPRVGYLRLSVCYISQRVAIGLSRFIERLWVS